MSRLQAGGSGVKSWKRQDIFLVSKTHKLALGSTQPPIQWVPAFFFLDVKPVGCEVNHFQLVSRLRMSGAITLTPHVCLHGVDTENFKFFIFLF